MEFRAGAASGLRLRFQGMGFAVPGCLVSGRAGLGSARLRFRAPGSLFQESRTLNFVMQWAELSIPTLKGFNP